MWKKTLRCDKRNKELIGNNEANKKWYRENKSKIEYKK